MKYFTLIALILWQTLHCATALTLEAANTEIIANQITADLRFALDHAEPDQAAEALKDHRLKCPAPLIRGTYGKTANDANDGLAYLHTCSREILENLTIPDAESSPGIPLVTHRIWLTDNNNPSAIPEEHIRHYIESVRQLNNLGCGWKHKFWCWQKNQITTETLRLFEAEGIEIVEMNTAAYLTNFQAMHFVHAAIDHGLYTLAGNILRNNILLFEGGLYMDMGTEILLNPTPLMKKSDIFAHLRKGRTDKKAWWIDHDFMAAKPHNPINRLFLERIARLHKLVANAEVTNFFNNPRMMHCWTNARLLTELFCLFSEEHNLKAVMLPDANSFFGAHHLTSWYGGGEKSCRDIDNTTLNWFRVHPDYEQVKQALLKDRFNPQLYKTHFAPQAVTAGEMIHHFLYGSPRLSTMPLAGDKRVVVTLTSWPGKIHNAYLAIRSLLNQTLPPNEIVLCLADEEFPDRQIPATLSALVNIGLLTVKWHPTNIRSAKKLIPALMDPRLNIEALVTADDDIVYKPDWLQQLVEGHLRDPEAIIAHRARAVQFEESGELKPYSNWRLQQTKEGSEGKLLFTTSGGGMLFPPNSLHPGAVNADLFMRLTPTGDDIFWWVHALMQGTKIVPPEHPQTGIIEINDEAAKAISLWITNQLGANDSMLQALLQHYKTDERLRTIFPHLKVIQDELA
jgi:hypothetical protein